MSKNKDIKKAEAGQPFKHPGEALEQCPFPNCTHTFRLEEGQANACAEHRRFMMDYIWCCKHIVFGPAPTAPPGKKLKSLLIPKPGMADRAIAEAVAIEKAGGKKQ